VRVRFRAFSKLIYFEQRQVALKDIKKCFAVAFYSRIIAQRRKTCLTDRPTGRPAVHAGLSDPLWPKGRHCDNGLSYARDNRVIVSESSHCRYCLLPRCRLILSSGCTSSEGFCCSQTKKVRELGSIRRKAVWLIPAVRKESARWGGLLVRKDQSACINCEPIVGYNWRRRIATCTMDKG